MENYAAYEYTEEFMHEVLGIGLTDDEAYRQIDSEIMNCHVKYRRMGEIPMHVWVHPR